MYERDVRRLWATAYFWNIPDVLKFLNKMVHEDCAYSALTVAITFKNQDLLSECLSRFNLPVWVLTDDKWPDNMKDAVERIVERTLGTSPLSRMYNAESAFHFLMHCIHNVGLQRPPFDVHRLLNEVIPLWCLSGHTIENNTPHPITNDRAIVLESMKKQFHTLPDVCVKHGNFGIEYPKGLHMVNSPKGNNWLGVYPSNHLCWIDMTTLDSLKDILTGHITGMCSHYSDGNLRIYLTFSDMRRVAVHDENGSLICNILTPDIMPGAPVIPKGGDLWLACTNTNMIHVVDKVDGKATPNKFHVNGEEDCIEMLCANDCYVFALTGCCRRVFAIDFQKFKVCFDLGIGGARRMFIGPKGELLVSTINSVYICTPHGEPLNLYGALQVSGFEAFCKCWINPDGYELNIVSCTLVPYKEQKATISLERYLAACEQGLKFAG